ncbi:nitroreductase [Rhodococcus sp. IEGM 1305]|uniref:nitroreductase n=1 Tax=Rhodococcus sp. IEGM 1305 TaxID=3047092 RepID=UPI0024B71B40|nr:nitroreductase [Rhodococcus sp. IEGM 1305]MDI9953286.1 nitroreductase [Rhodococcus sp. IEGM 1305]
MSSPDAPSKQQSATAVLRSLMVSRRSTRGFTAEPVARDRIETLLDLARLAPSWCNTQPWRVVVTEGIGTERFRSALAEHTTVHAPRPDFAFPTMYSGITAERRRRCARQLYDAVGVEWGDYDASAREAARNFEFFGAPHVAVVSSPTELGTYGAVDCGVYTQSFLLAAESLGLGAVPQAAIAVHSDFVRKHLGIPADYSVVCGISFGHRDEAHPANTFRTPRTSTEDYVLWRTR